MRYESYETHLRLIQDMDDKEFCVDWVYQSVDLWFVRFNGENADHVRGPSWITMA